MKKYKKNWTTFDSLDMELFAVTEILKLKSLHYGYWLPEEKLTLENLQQAQSRYTETLLEMLPLDIGTVLDVGAGIGDNTAALCRCGYSVTALSPDRNHIRYFENMPYPQLRFVSSKLEDYRESGNYDLILMSESNGYFYMDTGFTQSRRLLRPGGYLLVSGMFRQDNDCKLKSTCDYYDFDTEQDYKVHAEKYGLNLMQRIDITDETLPTLVMAYDIYKEKIVPFLAMMDHYLKSSAGWKWKLLKIAMRKQFHELKTIQQMYDQRVNPDVFAERARYLRLLFQLSPLIS
jgi:cyclopropane fatty-acyl-phospholipid synthase-like methyltransferase